MALIDRAKTTLRISHTKLDSEIGEIISTARAELIRLGVSEVAAASTSDALVNDAVLTFVLYKMASKGNEQYFESWQYQADCLRKSASHNGGDLLV